MEDDVEKLAFSAIVIASILKKKRKKVNKSRKKRSEWVKSYLQRREQSGLYTNLVNELRSEEPELFKNYLRMTKESFDHVLSLVKADLTKETTNMREPISPGLKLAVTIRFLATGASYDDLSCQYRVHKSTICRFIPEVCEVLYERLKNDYLKV